MKTPDQWLEIINQRGATTQPAGTLKLIAAIQDDAINESASIDLLGTVKQRFFTMTLGDCPPGLFLFNGHFGFKTEYTNQNGPEAYVVKSGEYFWGGADGDKCKRANLVVMPVIIEVPNAPHELPATKTL